MSKVFICERDGCENQAVRKAPNQKYCSPECTRTATNAKMRKKYYSNRARKLGIDRFCVFCQTKLSRYNVAEICNACSSKKENSRTRVLLDLLASIGE